MAERVCDKGRTLLVSTNIRGARSLVWVSSESSHPAGQPWEDRELPPLALLQFGSHLLALAEALEWALRLEISMDLEGRAKALRDLRRDPSPRRLLHSRAQLLLAGLACRLGWPRARAFLPPMRASQASTISVVTGRAASPRRGAW